MFYSIIVYTLTFAISLTCIFLYKKIEKGKLERLFCLIGIILPPILLSTFRYGIGVDYHTYVSNYNYFSNQFSFKSIFCSYQEPFSVILYFLAKIIFSNSIGFFLLSILITIVFTFLGIKNYKERISMPLALFIYYMFYYQISYNAVRQCIAVAIVFFAYKYVIERKPIKYIIFITIAGLFHKTAFLCLLFYFLGSKEENKRSKIIDRVLFIGVVLSPIIVPLLMRFIPGLMKILGIFTSYANKPVRRISM